MIRITIDDQQIRQAFARLIASAKDPRPVLEQVGELLVDSTKQRFATSTAPDGSRWAPNSEATYLQWLRRASGKFGKDRKRIGTKGGYFSTSAENKGKIIGRGISAVMSKRPLIGEGGALSTQIFHVAENGTLVVGSTMEYAAAQQFGMKAGYAGATKRGSPIPWGDIPARPFLGLSEQDRGMILDQISDHLNGALQP